MAKTSRRPGLNGPEGLFCAVVDQATADVIGEDCDQALDALDYFAGRVYAHHVTALGLPAGLRPAALQQEETLIRLIDLVLEDDE